MTMPRVLTIFAHPDDESLLAGGTLGACAAAGAEVGVLCLTRGEAGPVSEGSATGSLGARREAELKAAAQALGVQNAGCLDYPDGALEWVDADDIEPALVGHMRSFLPDILITFGPEGWYWHPDHIAVHRFVDAALDRLVSHDVRPALYLATWPDGWMTGIVDAVRRRGLGTGLWGLHPSDFGAPAASITLEVDVTAYVPAKLRAIRSHRSQIGPDHVFAGITDDLALRYLGREFFACARPPDGGIDPLAEIVGTARVVMG